MYKIGEFSKITNLTVKALRYYDEQGLLVPSNRGENDYRLYDDRDFDKARLILFLRNLDFSISEIKDVLSRYENKEDLSYYLAEKKAFIERRIKQEKALIEQINHYLLPENNKEVNVMNYDIVRKELEPVTVASIRFKGKYADVGKYVGTLYKAVKDKAAGAPFNCYHDAEYKETADIELCVPTRGPVSANGITAKQLPHISAITTIHTGSYETINLAYKALLDYAKEKELPCKLPSREIYHKGPGMIFKGNPDKYITEIVIPVE